MEIDMVMGRQDGRERRRNREKGGVSCLFQIEETYIERKQGAGGKTTGLVHQLQEHGKLGGGSSSHRNTIHLPPPSSFNGM